MKLYDFLQTSPLFRVFLLLMAGVLSGEYLFDSLPPAAVTAAVVFSLSVSLFLRRNAVLQSILVLFSVYLTGICIHSMSSAGTVTANDGIYKYHAVVTSSVRQNNGFSSFDIVTARGNEVWKLKATVRGTADLYPGDRLNICSKIKMPAEKHGQRFSYALYLKRNGYAGTTFLNSENITFEGNRYDDMPAWTRIKITLLQLRSSLLSRLHERGLSGRDFATVSAMAFGEKTYLTKADREMYSRTGVSHVLALSGLHIGIIYAFLTFFMTFIPKIPRFIAIQAAIWFYVIFAGMSPSLIRAALMISIYSAGELMHRDRLSINSLSFAGTLSVLISPMIIFDICFQLSFLSVFSIMLFYRPLTDILPSRPLAVKKIMQMISVSLAAYIGTMPVILYNFGSLSYCFVFTNLIVIPLTTIIIYLSILSFVPFIGNFISSLLISSVHILNTAISKIAGLQYTGINNIRISLLDVLLIYIMILSVYFLYHTLKCKKH